MCAPGSAQKGVSTRRLRGDSLERPERVAGSVGVLRLDVWCAARTTHLAQDDKPQDYGKSETAVDAAYGHLIDFLTG